MTVVVLLTGENNGLSAPVSFDSIENQVERVIVRGLQGVRMRLGVAVDFVMFLEQREAAVFGPQPDSVASTVEDFEDMYWHQKRRAVQLGWKYGPIVGPSSKWVFMERHQFAFIARPAKLVKMSSNSSLHTLADIVSRECDTSSLLDRLPSLGDDVPIAWIPMTKDSYGGMTECEVPGDYTDAYKASGSESFGGYFNRQLRATRMNMSQVGIYSAKENNEAPASGHPMSIMALGTLALATFITLGI
ncbi:hypothetical protein FLAG1_11476 [Fusarium langsethiae]|uniref:Uncharacterized protein n=1 Tax=Fusarium langsethiae TaxID=179993 RepID=A0A0M9EMK2_FUSLA|nr:hypothetical protein FLAG1_11476 [Fusarium langsethiae]GKU09792.1 unnamed protein product [Fusarium langsethiae]GKU23076.1 unnamed protein product [Fusarium langsethiae]